MLARLALSLCLSVLLAARAQSADEEDEATAKAYLSSRGLTAAGFVWLAPEEVQLRKRLEGLEALDKRFRQAAQTEKAMLLRNEAARAQLALAEAGPAKGGKTRETPPAASSGKSSSGKSPSTDKASARSVPLIRTTPAPSNVGPNTAVLRGIGNFENASRGTPEIV